MPQLKAIMKMKVATIDGRVGGFSDSFYFDGTYQACLDKLRTAARARAKILPAGGGVHEISAINITNPGASSVLPISEQGKGANIADIPQMAEDTYLYSGDLYKRSFQVRGIPDDMMRGGAVAADAVFRRDLTAFLRSLVGFQLKVVVKTNPTRTVTKFDEGSSTFTTEDAHGLAAGNKVKFFRAKHTDGSKVSGTFVVLAAPTVTTFTLVNSAVFTAKGWKSGKVRKYEVAYVNIDGIGLKSRATTRKVGRPSDAYSGRR